MLYLNPPFHVVEGVSLFPDHGDPQQFYYLPLAPRLSAVEDDGRLVPRIQLVRYRGTAGSGGFLNFDVDLGIDRDVLDDVTAKVASIAGVKGGVRLAPVPLVDGSVKLLLFGKDSTATPPDAKAATVPAPGPEFVLKMAHHAKPALYGDNQATFSVHLDQYGVTVMEKALAGETSPIGIVYSLDYLGLRPAYAVRVQAHWDRVQKHLEEKFKTDAIVLSSEVDTVVDELVESRAITIEADTFIPEGEDAALLGRRDQAMNEVREMVTSTFFTPSIEPVKEQRDGWDKFADTVTRLSQAGRGGGLIPSFSYSKVDLTRIDRKSLDVNMSERTTVKRSVYPQGHLAGLARSFLAQGVDPSRFVIDADLDDPYFRRRKVTAISRANFVEDSIASIDVQLDYGGDSKSVLLETSDGRATAEWASIVKGGRMQTTVDARYKVSFQNVDGTERPVSLKSPPRPVETDHFEVNPRELYTIVPIPITALSFPWDRYPTVEVDARYADETNGIDIEDHFLLDARSPEKTWKIFVLDPSKREVSYRVTYRAADLRDVAGPWETTTREFIPLRDPFPNKRTVDVVVPGAVFGEIERVFVDLSYEDEANGIFEERSLHFDQGTPGSQSFVVDLRDPTRRRVGYSISLLFRDGRTREIPLSFTTDRRIVVHPDMKGHRIATFRLVGDARSSSLREVRVESRYVDESGGLSFAGSLALRPEQPEQVFEFDYADPSKAGFEYRLTYLYDNGLTKTTDWIEVDAEDVPVSAGSPN